VDQVTLDFEEYDLDNGLHVILHEDRHAPLVAVNLWYHVGSKNEREGRTGFAHLFEHMMFQGSANVPPNGHFRHVQEAGGTLNGSTSFDRTNYFETLPAHRLELGLWLEADRMRSLAVTAQTLETQRSAVMEERRSRYDNQPYGGMYEELFSRAYKLQPYRWPTIGSMADIRNAALPDVLDFHGMYYRPGNASLCIAGDIEPREGRALVDRHFGDIPDGGGEVFRPFIHEPQQLAQVRDYVYDNVPLPAVIMGMHVPDLNADDMPAIDVLAELLTSGHSSRLYRALVYEARVAQSVRSYALGLELPGLFLIHAVAQPGCAIERVEELIWRGVARLREDAVTPQELEKAVNRLEAAFIHSVTALQSRADQLNAYHTLSRDTALLNRECARLRAITADDVRAAAERYLTERNGTVLYYLPYPMADAQA
jgi:predicted Zn-dependent peptidase